jgi:hypothetical protein
VDPIPPIGRTEDRTVQPVDLPRLRPLEREAERRRRERERRRRQAPSEGPPKRGAEPDGGIDVRA